MIAQADPKRSPLPLRSLPERLIQLFTARIRVLATQKGTAHTPRDVLALLLSSLTRKKPTQRQMEAIQLHLMGDCSEAELEKSLFAGL